MTNDELYTLIAGIRPNQMPKITEQMVEKIIRLQVTSGHSLRKLDITESVLMREEDRKNHTLISGTTREGKSKFMEYMAREDIKRGYCVVFADPTDNAQTAYSLLNWCVSQGHKKVVLIDPFLEMVPVINPLDQENKSRSLHTVMEAFKLLFEIQDLSQTAIIADHMTSILHVLLKLGLPLFDALYFTRFGNPYYTAIQQQILSQLPDDEYAIDLQHHLSKQFLFDRLGSTTRRFRPIFGESLQWIFAGRTGINFKYLIENGYTVLINLYPGNGMSIMESRFLGVVVLLEMINAMENARGEVCFYIDEAQRFINRGVIDVLAHRQKRGFYLTVAHQYEDQFEEQFIRSGVRNLCKNFVMFHTPDFPTKFKLLERFFGSKAAEYADIHLSKQEALIKINKEDPQLMRVPHVQTPEVTNQEVLKFIDEHIFTKQPWYQLPANIAEECYARYSDVTPTDNSSPREGSEPDGRSTGGNNRRKKELNKRGADKTGKKENREEDTFDFSKWSEIPLADED